jgi:hypothetical protein
MKAKVAVEFFTRNGHLVDEYVGDLDVDIIRRLRNTGLYYAGYLSFNDGSKVSRMYFDDRMSNLIPVLNNILEEVAHA